MERERRSSNFLREIIARDVAGGTHGGRVALRFPPEPNGYPHLGHAKAICLNFGLAHEFGGRCNLRYDDTNPETESPEYVEAIEESVRWLGYDPSEILFTSDYFEQLYEWAVLLVEKGLAYVDSQSEDEIRASRGTVTQPGTPSPYRDRPAEESLRLLDEMKRGLHEDGAHVLRARIDMGHPNMKLRDPLMYRIRRDQHHYRRGDDWKIYPFYDWAHGQSDAIEEITHSICTLEFDVNRPLYDWFLDAIGIPEPRNHQFEFARLNLDYTVMSKRRLLRLVEEGLVAGWDDPRMPTIFGQRRRGVRPEAVRAFCEHIGVSNVDGRVELSHYEFAVRDDLNHVAPRVMAVSRPLKLVIANLPEETVWIDAPYWPHDVTPPEDAPRTRRLPITREVWIDRDDFAEEPEAGWKRLAPGAEVRLRHGYVVRCNGVARNARGEVIQLRAEADLETLGADPKGRKVRGVIHWVSAWKGVPATFRLYDRLFREPAPEEAEDFLGALNSDSLIETEGFVEPSVLDDPSDTRYQFERLGYFWRDPEDSAPDTPIFNRIVALRDGWAKREAAAAVTPGEEDKAKTRIVTERDPTALLTDEQRAVYDDLIARDVGEEEAAVLAADATLGALFEATVSAGAHPREAGILLIQDLRPILDGADPDPSKTSPESIAEVLRLLDDGTITRASAREVVEVLVREGGAVQTIVNEHGLAAVRDEKALLPVIDEVIASHPDEVARYRAGEQRLVGFLMGQAMRQAPKGTDAAAVRGLLEERLKT